MLYDLLGVSAPVPGTGRVKIDQQPDPQSTAGVIDTEADADRIAAIRRDLLRLCDPEVSNALSPREQVLLRYALEGHSTAEIGALLRMTDQAVHAAMYRIRRRVPQGLRAMLSSMRRSSTPT
jgi:DNA-directed RNA polymerase specialized sigma24 family protein